MSQTVYITWTTGASQNSHPNLPIQLPISADNTWIKSTISCHTTSVAYLCAPLVRPLQSILKRFTHISLY